MLGTLWESGTGMGLYSSLAMHLLGTGDCCWAAATVMAIRQCEEQGCPAGSLHHQGEHRMAPVGHTVLEPCVSYSAHCCYSTGEKGQWECFNTYLCIAASMQSPSTPQKGKGPMCLAPPRSHPPSPKPQLRNPLWLASLSPSSSPPSTYLFARDGITGAGDKSGAISECSVPDCVKSSFCDFLM